VEGDPGPRVRGEKGGIGRLIQDISRACHRTIQIAKALVVTTMGGVANMLGSLVAGLLLGVAESLYAYLLDSGLTLAVAMRELMYVFAVAVDRV